MMETKLDELVDKLYRSISSIIDRMIQSSVSEPAKVSIMNSIRMELVDFAEDINNIVPYSRFGFNGDVYPPEFVVLVEEMSQKVLRISHNDKLLRSYIEKIREVNETIDRNSDNQVNR